MLWSAAPQNNIISTSAPGKQSAQVPICLQTIAPCDPDGSARTVCRLAAERDHGVD